MVAGCELWDTSEVDAEWEAWEAKCQAAWEARASELVALGYSRIPDNLLGAIFEKYGRKFYLARIPGKSTWALREASKRAGAEMVRGRRG